ncbi:flagellar hook-basal body protein [Pseudoflavonifractor sp. 60]|uniref:flagellar hook-basal body protein n=1 Tax=Pseudoflavonifractor sp. 60 TaxID=2304576 RepID=UPI0013688CF7|nr:flagellar hook-basal body protein [Pseudoflavonifractor sp. 60]MCI8914282.1 flagellar hook-basal body protein [Lawsonibacter sp.]NBI68053.1 flagellar hook-basal body protein [Pseudoflavonifractor sp. 60]
MMKGFYNLTSGMLSQGRRLDVVANNMTNISTAGYKAETYTDRTFDEVMVSRIGNKIKTPYQTFETYQAYILAPDQLYTDFSQSSFEETNLPLDFAIQGEGFFAIDTGDGVAYTRAGSFTLDNEGYLCLSELGRVLDREGNPIQMTTDRLEPDKQGALYSAEGNEYFGTLGVFTFEDNDALERTPYGLFIGEGAQVNEDVVIHHKWVERSNVNMVKEMVKMMATQRVLQSAAQMSKIYDQVITKAVTDIGRL